MTWGPRAINTLAVLVMVLAEGWGLAWAAQREEGGTPRCASSAVQDSRAGDRACDPVVPQLDLAKLEGAEMYLPAEALAASDQSSMVAPGPLTRMTVGEGGATSTTLLNETFEGTWPGSNWQVGVRTGYADARWGRSSYRKAAGSYSMWCAKTGTAAPADGGTVPKNMYTWAVVGPFNLSTYSSGSLAFDLWQQTGTGDYLFFGASIEGSNFTGWNVTSNTSGFQRTTQSLTSWGSLGNLTGRTSVWFGFFYISDTDESRAEGAYVDNIVLTADAGGGGGSCGTYVITDDNDDNSWSGAPDGDWKYCLFRTDPKHPIEFHVDVTQTSITSAQLMLLANDVDELTDPNKPEVDKVYVNNTYVGNLTGADNEDSTTTFILSPSTLVAGGRNTIRIDVNQDPRSGPNDWCVNLKQAQLIINGGCQGTASCRSVTTNKTSYAPGETVQVTYEVDTSLSSQQVRVESNIKNPSGQIVAGTERTYTTSGTTNDPQTVNLTLPSSAVGGTYKVEILVFDKASGRLESTCSREFTVTGGGGSSCGTYITTEDNENNTGGGVADNDMGVSGKGGCLFNTDPRHPIEFNIFVTGPLPTSSAILYLETWDVDYPNEINEVYVNNTKVGETTGANTQWSNPSFSVPLSLVRAGKNTIKVMVDTKNSGTWCTWVAQAQLIIDGGCQGSASCRYVNTNKTSYAPGETVQVTYEIDTSRPSQEVRVESNLKNPAGQIIAGLEKVYTTSGNANDPQTVNLTLPNTAPGGTYKAEVLVFDKATGRIESSCSREFSVTGGGAGCTLSCTATVPATALVGQAVTFTSSASATGCSGALEYFWFFGDGTTAVAQTQNTSYTYTQPGTYTWELVVVAQTNVVCRKTGTIIVSTSSGGCSLGCNATVPATAAVGQTISFQGSASTSGCAGSPEYFWFFGDGTTAVAQSQNTTFAYRQPGTYTWELVVVVGQTICRRSGTIIITGTTGSSCTVGCTALVPATGQVNVPVPLKASATTANCQGSPEYFWSVEDGTTAVAQAQNTSWTFPAPGVYRWHLSVVVGGVVCRRTGTITIAASSGCNLDCTALVPTVAQVGQSVNFRGFATWSRCSAPPLYVWDFGDRSMPAGGNSPTKTYHAPGSWEWQMTAVVDGVYCVRSGTIVVPGAGGTQPPPTGCNYSTWFQVGSRAAGALGSQWRTDVFILNLANQTAQVTARLYTSSGVQTLAATVPAQQHRTLADVVGQMNYTGSAALELCSDQPVRAASRTYNRKSATETFGQYYRAFTTTQAMAAGQTGWLVGLKENSQFRSNIALTNSGRTTARVAVTLYDGSGDVVTAYTVTLAPGEWKQENRPYANRAGRTNIDEGYARVEVLAGTGVEASASAVDAGTNDPTTLPALP